MPVQIPQSGFDYSNWLPGLAKSMVGFRIDENGSYEHINLEDARKLREESKRSVTNESMTDWIEWLTDDSPEAKAASVGDATRESIANDLAKSDFLPDLVKAIHIRPSDPELLSRIAQLMLETFGVNEKHKRPATYFSAKARELGGDNAVVFYRSAQVEKILNNKADALKYIDRAIELDSANTEYSEFKKTLLQNN